MLHGWPWDHDNSISLMISKSLEAQMARRLHYRKAR